MMAREQQSGPTQRQVVKFPSFRVDPAWRRLATEERERTKRELCAAVESFGDRLLTRSYSLVGMRGDADLLLWQIGDRLEEAQGLPTAGLRSATGPARPPPPPPAGGRRGGSGGRGGGRESPRPRTCRTAPRPPSTSGATRWRCSTWGVVSTPSATAAPTPTDLSWRARSRAAASPAPTTAPASTWPPAGRGVG